LAGVQAEWLYAFPACSENDVTISANAIINNDHAMRDRVRPKIFEAPFGMSFRRFPGDFP